MPRSTWEAFPFADDIVMSEDQEWSRRVLLAGHAIGYEPAAAVHHSHTYSVEGAFRRFFDSGVSAERSYVDEANAPGARVGRGRPLRTRRIRVAVDDPSTPVDPVHSRL